MVVIKHAKADALMTLVEVAIHQDVQIAIIVEVHQVIIQVQEVTRQADAQTAVIILQDVAIQQDVQDRTI